MITYNEEKKLFKLDTSSTSYIFKIGRYGHPEHIYYGKKLHDGDFTALELKNDIMLGSSVDYCEGADGYSLDNILLEYSGIGKGDYRHSPIELIMPDGSFVCDFVFRDYKIEKGGYRAEELPTAEGGDETLSLVLCDKKYPGITLTLHYTVFGDCDVIARNAVLGNTEEKEIYIRKLMSFSLDFPTSGYDMITLNGSWAKEAHVSRRKVAPGLLVNDSTTGASSNRHNPGFLLAACGSDEEHGAVYGFNLVYSGNHYSAVECGPFNTVRIMSGINPHCFLWRLKCGESFETPQAVMSYSDGGTNGFSDRMHRFVNSHIVRGKYKLSERPIVINNWEATFFNFNRRKILALAGRAKKLGIEMLVLDDGWFGKRNSDTCGLGDWTVNKKKLPGGITGLCKKINSMGLRFGLWFEPECVNEDSELYRAHPDWAIKVSGRAPGLGRNQLILDLTRKEVREYIVEAVDAVLSSCNVEYVKWDYNRHISDAFSPSLKMQGEFSHRYILGLYEILGELFHKRHPEILLESCSSGGNRFDLGMLCYSPQIWTSDNTDPIERLDIQGGIYLLYPPSTVSNHVSMAPHQQTLRETALSTRFNVAAFGVLGYELDFSELTPEESWEIKEQVAFYKAHRRTFQFGRLRCVPMQKEGQISWQTGDENESVAGVFQRIAKACPPRDNLRIVGLDASTEYTVSSVRQYARIRRFGTLIKHILPFPLRADGFILRTADKYYALTDGAEEYRAYGDALSAGINLAMQYEGTGYAPSLRLYGDFGSGLYIVNKITEKEEENG